MPTYDYVPNLEKRIAKLERENQRLREALTPSADTKAAYWGSDELECTDWTLIKNIMRLICKRAALAEEGDDGDD